MEKSIISLKLVVSALLSMFLTNSAKATIVKDCDFQRRYSFKERLGRGAFGVTFRAVRTSDSKVVVVKEQDETSEFFTEVKTLRLLKGSNAPKLYDTWHCNEKGYIAMEFLNSCFGDWNYTDAFVDKFILNLRRILAIFAKQYRFIHGDMHKGNVMCLEPKNSKISNIKVIDFGLATEVSLEAWERQEKELQALEKIIRARDSSVEASYSSGASRVRSRSRSRNRSTTPPGLVRPNFREINKRQTEEKKGKGGVKKD